MLITKAKIKLYCILILLLSLSFVNKNVYAIERWLDFSKFYFGFSDHLDNDIIGYWSGCNDYHTESGTNFQRCGFTKTDALYVDFFYKGLDKSDINTIRVLCLNDHGESFIPDYAHIAYQAIFDLYFPELVAKYRYESLEIVFSAYGHNGLPVDDDSDVLTMWISGDYSQLKSGWYYNGIVISKKE